MEIEGVLLKNPVVIASCPLTESVTTVKLCEENGAGAVILKTAANYVREGEIPPRKFLLGKDGYWAQSTFEREIMTGEEAERILEEAKESVQIPVIASIAAKTLQPEEWIQIGKQMERAGAAMLQLDFFYLDNLLQEENVAEKMCELLRRLRRECRIPIIPKININQPAAWIFPVLVKAGIQTVSLLDSIRVPIVKEWISPYECEDHALTNEGTSYFGRWQLPISLNYLLEARKCGLEVIGGGGIRSVEDAKVMLQNGAKAIQIASVAMFGNYHVIREYLEKME